MAFTCNPELRAILNGAAHKLQWATNLNSAMGNNRVIRCFRDSNVNAVNPFNTGVEFRNVGSTGAIGTKAGAIVKLGRLKGTTVSLAANMLTGKSIVRVEGGGHWFQGTLGLTKEAQIARGVAPAEVKTFDFYVPGDFTTTNGLGITPNLSVSGPRFLPSGTGTAVPALTANAPATVEIWNFTNPASPFMAGSIPLNVRDDDLVHEDAEMAAEIGDVGVYMSNSSVMHGTIEFGATMLVCDKHNLEVQNGNEPLYEVMINAAVRGTWTSYPYRDTFDPANHVTIPDAFKAVIKNAAGQILFTHQWSDGSAINSVKVGPWQWSATTVVRPPWTTGMVLPWQSSPSKMSSRANKWYPGMTDAGKRPSRAKGHYTSISVEPLRNGGYGGSSANGLNNIYASVQWPQPMIYPPRTPADPYFGFEFDRSGSSAEFNPWFNGWDFEPGSMTAHNWYSSPGGPRFDRAPIPSVIALWLSDPNGSRLQGNVPWKSMGRAWNLAYANHSNHWCQDPKTMKLGLDNNDLLDNHAIVGHYYGDSPTGTKKVIDQRGDMRDDIQPRHLDKNGNLFWSGWARDTQHSYAAAGWGALSMNSPMMTVLSKWDTFWQLVVDNGIDVPEGSWQFFRGAYMYRTMSWLWLQYTLAWKVATTHRLGFSREQIESRFVKHLESLHRSVYVPVHEQNEMSLFAQGLRNLGQPVADTGYTTGALGMYTAGALALMKQTGMWSAVYGKGGKCKQVLDMVLRHYDTYCFDVTLDTGMDSWPGAYVDASKTWGQNRPRDGLTDCFHDAAGNWVGDRDVSIHPFLMYAYVRRDFFPEFPHPRLAAACAKIDAIQAKVQANIDATSNLQTKRERDHTYGYPGVAIWKAPTELGPA